MRHKNQVFGMPVMVFNDEHLGQAIANDLASAKSEPAPDCRDKADAEEATPPYDRKASRVWATRMPTLKTTRNAVRASNIGVPINGPK
jgi:hypothetical protein